MRRGRLIPAPTHAAEILIPGDFINAAATLLKQRLRLGSLRSALANSSVKSSGMDTSNDVEAVQTIASNKYRFIFIIFRIQNDDGKSADLCIKIRPETRSQSEWPTG